MTGGLPAAFLPGAENVLLFRGRGGLLAVRDINDLILENSVDHLESF